MAKLIPFPTSMLAGFIKKAAYYLPQEHRSPIMEGMRLKNTKILEKAKLIVTSILVAKQSDSDESFIKDVNEAFESFTLNEHEFALFDGFLGGTKSMLLELAKKGVTPVRLQIMRDALVTRKENLNK